MTSRRPQRRVAGFTLLETLVALAITSLALSVMLTVGMKGAGAGFRLGARAVGNADQQVSLQAVRITLDNLVIPPIAVSSAAAEAETEEAEQEGQGDTFEGLPDQLSAYIIAARDTPCLPVGGQGRITLAVRAENQRTLITCQLAGEDVITLANLNWPNASFTYSDDALSWTDNWTVLRGEPVADSLTPDAELRKVYIRVASQDGQNQVIAVATSGRALPQTAPAATQ